MLMTGKKWQCKLPSVVGDTNSLVDLLLESREIVSDVQKKDFLSDNPTEWHDPFLFQDMKEAVDITVDAISNDAKILVYGDYDADGVTATTILVRYFKSHGCDVDYIVPQRAAHGYGLTDYILEDVLSKNPDLLITVDCGISNFDTISQLRSKGITIIVTDHHTVQEKIPDADAVICAKRLDNTYPCKDLCGAGVAMKFIEAMGRDGRYKVFPDVWKQTIELSGIATIADLVPIVGENRTLVKKAFQSMRNPSNLGIRTMNKELLDSGKVMDEMYISFNFVPRINAAGRLYDSSDALKLFLADDISVAEEACAALSKQNDERKAIEAKVFAEAVEQIESSKRPEEWLLTNTKGPIVAYGKDWHQGVLGIVAGKLSQHFRRSAIVFTDDGLDSENVKGSSRSYGDFDIYTAIENISEFCVNFGGHKKAAGLVVKKKNMSVFMRELEKYSCEAEAKAADENPDEDRNADILKIDAVLPAEFVVKDTYEKIRCLAPFGLGNTKPVFETDNLLITNIQTMSNGAHLRLDLYDTEKDPSMKHVISAVGFGMGNYSGILKAGDRVDIAYTMNLFNFKGEQTLSLHLSDIRIVFDKSMVWNKVGVVEELYRKGLAIDQIAKLTKGAGVDSLIPPKELFQSVYVTLKNVFGEGTSIVDTALLARMVTIHTGSRITPFQLARCVDVFEEAGLIRVGRLSAECLCFNLLNAKNKVDLKETATYMRLFGQGV